MPHPNRGTDDKQKDIPRKTKVVQKQIIFGGCFMYQKPFRFVRNVLFAVLPISLLTGCAGATAETDFQPVLDPAYTVQAEMDYADGQQASLAITRCADGVWDMTFSEPPALAGVVLTFDGGAVSASYKGLSFTVPKSAVGAKTMLLYVTDVLDGFVGSEPIPCTQTDGGTWETSGECDGGAYTLTFSPDGKLSGLTLPSQPLTLTFSDYVCGETALPGTDTSETTTSAPAETSASLTETTAAE